MLCVPSVLCATALKALCLTNVLGAVREKLIDLDPCMALENPFAVAVIMGSDKGNPHLPRDVALHQFPQLTLLRRAKVLIDNQAAAAASDSFVCDNQYFTL